MTCGYVYLTENIYCYTFDRFFLAKIALDDCPGYVVEVVRELFQATLIQELE